MRLVGNASSRPTSDVHAHTAAPVESGANKEERGVLAAINRHEPTIIIDTRCPHNESIYTAVYRYVILSGVYLSAITRPEQSSRVFSFGDFYKLWPNKYNFPRRTAISLSEYRYKLYIYTFKDIFMALLKLFVI